MNETPALSYTALSLPPGVVSKLDVSRLVSELERIDNDLTTAAARAKAGVATDVSPRLSESLTAFLAQNKLMLTDAKARGELIREMQLLKDNAPVIHMTFAVEADPESLGQLAQWLRASVHPQALVAVGLQPALIAGVYLRTPNHVHDLSLRAALKGGRQLLINELERLHAGN